MRHTIFGRVPDSSAPVRPSGGAAHPVPVTQAVGRLAELRRIDARTAGQNSQQGQGHILPFIKYVRVT